MAIQYDICDEIPKEFNELKFGKNDNRYMIIELKKAENGKEKFVRPVIDSGHQPDWTEE